MDTLLHKFQSQINGVIEGFDRIVFKGILRPISYTAGMSNLLYRQNILFKDYKDWATTHSQKIIDDAEALIRKELGPDSSIIYIPSINTRKEALAHELQKKNNIEQGLIGVWSIVESGRTFKCAYGQGAPILKDYNSRFKHLYFYFDHADFGFMSIRLQTWAPYEIQIALNGREWLRRMLDKNNCKYIVNGNKFCFIDDYELAQRLLDSQVQSMWEPLLTSFLPDIFPSLNGITGADKYNLSYTWILWQSEWARDYIFSDPADVRSIIKPFLNYALLTGTGDRILTYFGQRVSPEGQPHPNANPEIMSRLNQWYDGGRVRHWDNGNSVKFYNEQNVLRFEMTMNDPNQFKIHRHTEGKPDEEKKLLPMRKGIADISVRTQISSNIVSRVIEQVSVVDTDKITVGELLSKITVPVLVDGKRFRALEPVGKDLSFLQLIADPKFTVNNITNRGLRSSLENTPWANGLKGKRLSGRISRQLRLLRSHGIIKKLPRQHKYVLTAKGRLLTTALNKLLFATIEDLDEAV